MKRKTEESLQSRIVKEFNNKFCLKHHKPRCMIFSVPNGGHRGNKLEAARLKASGVLSGVSDLIVLIKDKVLFIELKNGSKGVQSKSQKDFEKRVKDLGFKYYLCRTEHDFWDVIKTYSKYI